MREPEPFEGFYREHRGAVYRFFRRELGPSDAEDATQTAFAQAYGAYLRGSRPERPRAWLLTIADNLRRARFRRRRLADEAVHLEPELVPAPEADARVRDLREALEALPLNQRAALVLHEVAGLSYAEIGRTLRVSVGAVQMLLFRARRAMREELALGRRGFTVLPPWVGQLLSSLERLGAPARAAGAAAAVATAALLVPGAEPAAPTPPGLPAPAPAAGSLPPREEPALLRARPQPGTKPGRKARIASNDAPTVVVATPQSSRKDGERGLTAPATAGSPASPAALDPAELPLVPGTTELPALPPPPALPALPALPPLPEPTPLPEPPELPPPPPLPDPLP